MDGDGNRNNAGVDGAAANGNKGEFLRSFGKRTDVFPTILASEQAAFAYYYEDDPLAGCIRYPTEAESERLMGLPPDWTKYGADGEEIRSSSRYATIGNASHGEIYFFEAYSRSAAAMPAMM